MRMSIGAAVRVLAIAAFATTVLVAGFEAAADPERKGQPSMRVHYLEIVCDDVAEQCAAMEKVHGLSFGPAVAELGQARVAEAADGSLVGVRAPLAEHEQPIIRTYFEVEDIASVVEQAEAAGAMLAYPPTQQGDTGTWAIYILGGVQFGLWQR